MHACMYVCMHACMYACMHACMYVCMHACMYACMYVCMHACMYVCVWKLGIPKIYWWIIMFPICSLFNEHFPMGHRCSLNSPPRCGMSRRQPRDHSSRDANALRSRFGFNHLMYGKKGPYVGLWIGFMECLICVWIYDLWMYVPYNHIINHHDGFTMDIYGFNEWGYS